MDSKIRKCSNAGPAPRPDAALSDPMASEVNLGTSSGDVGRYNHQPILPSTHAPRESEIKLPTHSMLTERRGEREAKRQKVTHLVYGVSNVPSPVGKRRRGKSGWPFIIPLELVYEVLGYVSPGDLVNVSMTNKRVHKTLMEDKSVWVASRASLNVPEPPDNVSEPRWARFLFHWTCQVCGASDAIFVNLALLKRACGQCKGQHIVKMNHEWRRRNPPGGEVVSVIPYMLRSRSASWLNTELSGNVPGCDCYWREDLYSPLLKLRDLKEKLLEGLPGAEENVRVWKEERVAWVEKCTKLSREYEVWYLSLDGQYKSKEGAKRAQRLAGIKRRFIELGYCSLDIDIAFNVNSEGIRLGSATVTDEAWIKLRRRLEPTLLARKNWRLEKEALEIVRQRLRIFKSLYDGFCSRLRPNDRLHVPAYQFLRPLPGLSEHIDANKDATVTRRDFQAFIDKLPEQITLYWSEYRETIISQIPVAHVEENFDQVEMARFVFVCNASHSQTLETDGKLETTVARCNSGLLQGWLMIAQHSSKCEGRHCYAMGIAPKSARRHTIKLDNTHSEAATSLITLAGLDPKSATIADMDHANAFFVCEGCSSNFRQNIYSWRQALHRPCRKSHPLVFILASSEARANAIAHREWFEPQHMIWHCNHCSFSVTGKLGITKHLQDDHGVTKPGSDDFFLNENSRFDLPVYVYDYPLPGKNLYRCSHCVNQEMPSILRRRFLREGVHEHLRASHAVRLPQLNIDYSLAHTSPTDASPP